MTHLSIPVWDGPGNRVNGGMTHAKRCLGSQSSPSFGTPDATRSGGMKGPVVRRLTGCVVFCGKRFAWSGPPAVFPQRVGKVLVLVRRN